MSQGEIILSGIEACLAGDRARCEALHNELSRKFKSMPVVFIGEILTKKSHRRANAIASRVQSLKAGSGMRGSGPKLKKMFDFLKGKIKANPKQILKTALDIADKVIDTGSNLGIPFMGQAKKYKDIIKATDFRNPSSILTAAYNLNKTRRGGGVKLAGSGRMRIIGSREEVWDGSKFKTSGGLTKDDLMMNNKGKIVSKKQHARGKALAAKFGFKRKS